jgi:hypothetical protein
MDTNNEPQTLKDGFLQCELSFQMLLAAHLIVQLLSDTPRTHLLHCSKSIVLLVQFF